MTEWYEEWIEAGIRKEVKLLRDNGFNTECSCEHKMYVQCSLIPSGEMQRLDNLLFNAGYRDYHLEFHIERVSSWLNSFINISFYPQKEEDKV